MHTKRPLISALLGLPLLFACYNTGVSEGPENVVDSNFEVVALQFATASELAQVLNDLIGDAAVDGQESEVRIMSDQRTSSLLLMAPPQRMSELRDLIAQLDKEQ